MEKEGDKVPNDFLTLLLKAEGPQGLSRAEIEDNIITFIGAGHETTARALGWTLYLLAKAPWERDLIEQEIDAFMGQREVPPPHQWLDALPFTRSAFEEAMRLYPPAPSINREPIEDDQYKDLKLPKGAAVLVMPWTVHRHRLYWDNPKLSCHRASTRKIATRSTGFNICRSGPGRASASAPALPCRRRSSLWRPCSIAIASISRGYKAMASAETDDTTRRRIADECDSATVDASGRLMR